MAEVLRCRGLLPPEIEIASLYGLYAALRATDDAGLTPGSGATQRIAIIVGNLEPNSRPFDSIAMMERVVATDRYQTFPSIDLCNQIEKLCGQSVLRFVVHNTCASGNAALEFADRLIRRGVIDTAIVGAADAFSERIFAGFSALGVLGSERCRPFSKDRRFITISEGAAIAVLQGEHVVEASPYAKLVATASSNDAHHATNPSQKGIEECLAKLFAKSPVPREEVDFIFAHGTGSRANDQVEASIFESSYSNSAISAIKGTVGHLMGVAGALGTVSSCLSAKYRKLPPNNITNSELEYNINAPGELTARGNNPVYVQNNSFGFGGSNSVSIFRSM